MKSSVDPPLTVSRPPEGSRPPLWKPMLQRAANVCEIFGLTFLNRAIINFIMSFLKFSSYRLQLFQFLFNLVKFLLTSFFCFIYRNMLHFTTFLHITHSSPSSFKNILFSIALTCWFIGNSFSQLSQNTQHFFPFHKLLHLHGHISYLLKYINLIVC